MSKRIIRITPHQNAKVSAVLSGISGIFVTLLYIIVLVVSPSKTPSSTFIILLPFLYFVVTYISVYIACVIYNLLVPLIGGFEIEFETEYNDINV